MKIASWNVNSVKARLDRLVAWLKSARPDVLCLQELKTQEDSFPFESLEEAGYHAAAYGQKTYNGVAILSREKPGNVQRGFGDNDPQARIIAATVAGLRVVSVYVPNGQEIGSDKHAYKLRWLERFAEYLEKNYTPRKQLLVCGDFNIAPDDIDVARPDAWADSVLCDPAGRAAVEKIRAWGLVDVFRCRHPDTAAYSWWDYRRLAFPKNDGIRLDYILATSRLAKKCTTATIDRDARKGEKPSDHTPVVAVFDL
ncbi:MAG: exodeoxyribonuclease III [Planctomycetota bacterium]|nr:exodeoxyribonuclease III [Planctomycetota bacterium]